MPPFVRHLTAMRERGGRLIVIDPRRHRDRQAGRPAPAAHPRHRPGARPRPAAHRHRRGATSTRTTSPRGPPGFDAVRTSVAAWWPERVERITGVPVARMREAARAARRRGPGASILTARGAEQHAKGTDTVTAFINLALALGPARPAGLRVRLPHRAGQRPGRPRARPEGRPAPRLPQDRRPGRAGARRRAYGASSRRTCRAPAAPPTSCSTRSAPPAGPGRCWCSAPTRWSPRPGPGTIAERLDALDLLVVADFVLSETAALADVVLPTTQWAEETGTMTNLEGRVLLRRQAVARAVGGAERPGDPRGARRAAARRRAASPPTRERSSTSCAGPRPGGPADYAGITYERIDAETGVFWPCPAEDHPGTPRLFLRPFRHPRRPGQVRARRAPPARPRTSTTSIRCT